MSQKKLIMNLRGGLGNQLFGIYAALALEEELKVDCEIHTQGIDRSHAFSEPAATSFCFGRVPKFIPKRNLIERFYNKKQIRQTLKNSNLISGLFHRYHYTETYNHEKTLADLRRLLDGKNKTVVLDGFFQDFIYFNKVRRSLPDFFLVEETNWLKEKRELAKTLSPIMMHIRLGDYLRNGMQILTKDYFNEAISEIFKIVETDNLWVFSDSPSQATEYFVLPKNKNVTFITNDQKSTETLLLMREGRGLICSNSTFSYWAGKTSIQTRPVIYPKRISLNPQLKVGNIPRDWIPIKN